MKRHFEVLIGLLLMLALASPLLAGKTAPLPYSYFRVGNANDATTSTTPGVVMMGGGTDVDAAFQWMCGKSGNGDFLVIRATGTDAYNPYVRQLCPGVNSVATLIIPTTTAAIASLPPLPLPRAHPWRLILHYAFPPRNPG